MSQHEKKSITIGGFTYTVHPLPPDEAIDVFVDLAKSFGGGIASAVSALSAKASEERDGGEASDDDAKPAETAEETAEETDEEAAQRKLNEKLKGVDFSDVIDTLIEKADKATYKRIVGAMMQVTIAVGPDGKQVAPMVQDGQPVWKMHFQGRLPALLKVVRFAVGVNFGGFFAGSGSILSLATGLSKAMPKSAA
jgi:hypothetical protein